MTLPIPHGRKPPWLKTQLNTNNKFKELKQLMRNMNLHTVCEEARCPNIHECWGLHHTATFMLLGDTCTRNCKFCAVKKGRPAKPDKHEIWHLCESVSKMKLKHVVITMVTRDDLKDGGASIIADAVRSIKKLVPDCSVEVLISDFMGDYDSIALVINSKPDIIGHNIETVRRLSSDVRSIANYDRSLDLLHTAKDIDPQAVTKSSIMLGLGETLDEVIETMDDLRTNMVDIINIGQYLQPATGLLSVCEYRHPDEFAKLKEIALNKGFFHCESGPLVRSSYNAGSQFIKYKTK